MDAWTLRAAGAADAEFLYRVYASTRLEELSVTGWRAGQVEAFLRMQFAAQDSHYRQHHPRARFDLVLAFGAEVGRLYVDRADEIRVLDIALLPAYRRRGLGAALLRALLAEATATGQRVSLHVESNNPALGLYARLGFRPAQELGVYRLLHWQPAAADARAAQAGHPRDRVEA